MNRMNRGASIGAAVVAVAGLGLVGLAGYRAVSGNCLLGGCGDKSADTGAAVVATGAEKSSCCELGGSCEGETNVVTASHTEAKDDCCTEKTEGCCESKSECTEGKGECTESKGECTEAKDHSIELISHTTGETCTGKADCSCSHCVG
ncbi:MAG: hypothetical protein H6815_14045 [Phycisphaeraceae bacterium]|nr:hypothetical protein [Phycisphaerales bacterium]MCB9861561.1 hypothetical protein [Phycisphaeraceae bacterium]